MLEAVLLTSAALALATGLVVAIINPRRTINRSFAFITSLSAAWLICVFMAVRIGPVASPDQYSALLFWLRGNNAIVSFLPWSFYFILLAIVRGASLGGILKKSLPWLVASCSLAILAFTESFIPSDSTPLSHKYGTGHTVHFICLTTLCLLASIEAYRQMIKSFGIRSLEIRIFLFNSCLGALAIIVANAAGRIFEIQPLRHIGPFIILSSNSLTILGICHYRIFDARQIFAKLGHNISTLSILAVCTYAINATLTRSVGATASLLTGVVFSGIVALIWYDKSRAIFGLDIKQNLAGPRTQIINIAKEESDVGKLAKRFEDLFQSWCQTESVTYHTLESQEPPSAVLKTSEYPVSFTFLHKTGYLTPETISRRRSDNETTSSMALLNARNADALIAVPRGSDFPSSVVFFGPKQSLRPYTYPDIQLLMELVELMDNIISQARVATRTAQIEKMETAAMMSRGLAHDLNNLATPVSTFLLHMEDRVEPGSVEAEVLADANHSIRVMQDYIRESLFFARRLVPNFQRLLAGELLESTIKLTQSRAHDRGIEVVMEPAPQMGFTGDQALMQRLLQNLVLNGIDATPQRGRVTISASLVGQDRISLCVADQGPGVPSEIMDRIFEPYFTTKDTGDKVRGLGLGLAICLKISGLHGGEIAIGRTACGGAAFTVSLPVNPSPAMGSHAPGRAASNIPPVVGTTRAIRPQAS